MANTIRTFIAIKIIPEQKLFELITVLKNALESETLKWVEIDNLHLTLRFLGETTKEQVLKVGEMLERLSLDFHAFSFVLNEVGYYKKHNQPRVLFLNIVENPILKQIVNEIDCEMKMLGFDGDRRNFSPHLTLARIKSIKIRNAFFSLVESLNARGIQTVRVSEIIYYESILSSSGAKYNPLKIIKLK